MARLSQFTAAAAATLSLLVLLAGPVNAQDNITIYSTVIFSRMGERTPLLTLPDETVHLTSYGAQQMYQMVSLHLDCTKIKH
jgi:hypothetical protein